MSNLIVMKSAEASTKSLANGAATRFALAAALAVGGLALAGCEGATDYSNRAYAPIPGDTEALMRAKDMTDSSPILIRTYKKDATLEIWKADSTGRYRYLKTFPICRWSGQLGPKMREGDRQVPEGFYSITPAQMNPNSHYYLSFNVGYPNAYDREHGRSGGSIMVHGVCSSAGCFSMTDKQIGEIYALAREAFAGGQREIQMQALPFRMTAKNLAAMREDRNIAFWRELKVGVDHFDVTRRPPVVAVCGGHYHFGVTGAGGRAPMGGPCPALTGDPRVEAAVASKEQADDAKVAALVQGGLQPVRVVYADGGQNAAFATDGEPMSRPDAIASGPQIVPLDAKGNPIVTAIAKPTVAKPVASVAASAPPVTLVPASLTAQAPAAKAPAAGGSPLDGLFALFGKKKPVADAPPVDLLQPAAAAPLPPSRPADGQQAAADEPLSFGRAMGLRALALRPIDRRFGVDPTMDALAE